jgi:hypothetical protein
MAKKRHCEGRFALGGLAIFAIWLFVALPSLYFPTQANPDGNEHWPAVFGYRLKVTDTLVALFTGLLFVATMFLYRATKGLVAGAENTAQRQLRAYVYIEKTNFKITGSTWKITFRIRNFGQTPAHNVTLRSAACAVDWNGGNPEIPVPANSEPLGSMAPSGDFFDNESAIENISVDDVGNGNKAIYLVGTIEYDTIFDAPRRTTAFRYYIGGDAGCEGDELSADNNGNDAT